MKRSQTKYPLCGLDLFGGLQKAWEEGWLDEFSENHFLIKAIEGRLNCFQGQKQFVANNGGSFSQSPSDFAVNFCINFSCKITKMIRVFGEEEIKRFITNQLSAGKQKYEEGQFFRALSEVSVLTFWCMRSVRGEYEPHTNGDKNPEARFFTKNNIIVDVEVKTPGFADVDRIQQYVIPAILLNKEGRDRFVKFCSEKGLKGILPRVDKIRDFLNNAAGKFEIVDHSSKMNVLYINWSFSEFVDSSYEEAFGILANTINGILKHKDVGMKIGVHEEVYEKITAVVVYTESLDGLMFGDFRYIWKEGLDGYPHFAMISMHNNRGIFETTGMNPASKRPVPILLYLHGENDYFNNIMKFLYEHALDNQEKNKDIGFE